MSDDSALHDAKQNPISWNDIKRDMDQARNGAVLHRLTTPKHHDLLLEAIRKQHAERSNGRSPASYQLVEEITTSIANNTKAAAPTVYQSVEDDINATDISELLSLLFPSDDPMWSSYSEPEKEKIRELAESDELHQILRQNQFLENEGLAPAGELKSNIKEWIESGHAKKAVEYGTYAVMAGMLIAAPPVAASMAASMAMRRTVMPFAQKASEYLVSATEGFLVDNNVLTQEQVNSGREKLDGLTKKITGSKIGKFSLALGALAVTAAGASLAFDAASGEELGTRIGNLWDAGKGLFTEMPEAAEAELQAADADAVEAGEPELPAPDIDSLAHPQGGVYRDALAERFLEAGHVDYADKILALETDQLDFQMLQALVAEQNSLAAYLSPSQLEAAVSGQLGVDLAGVAEAAQAPIGTSIDAGPELTAEAIEAAANVAEGPAGSVEMTQAGAEVDGAEPEAAEPPTSVVMVDIQVAPGDTLSQSIFDAYRAEGVSLSAAELYGPSEFTSHPGGIVGEIAALNGLSNPDLIYPGQALQIEVHTTPGAEFGVTPAAEAAPATPEADISPEAEVVPTPETSTQPEAGQLHPEAIEAAQTVAASVPTGPEMREPDGGFSAEQKEAVKDAAKTHWLSGLAGAAGLGGVIYGIKRLMGKTDTEKDAVKEKQLLLSHEPGEEPVRTLAKDAGGDGNGEVEATSKTALKRQAEENDKDLNPDLADYDPARSVVESVTLENTVTARVYEGEPLAQNAAKNPTAGAGSLHAELDDLILAADVYLQRATEHSQANDAARRAELESAVSDAMARYEELTAKIAPTGSTELQEIIEKALMNEHAAHTYSQMDDNSPAQQEAANAMDVTEAELEEAINRTKNPVAAKAIANHVTKLFVTMGANTQQAKAEMQETYTQDSAMTP